MKYINLALILCALGIVQQAHSDNAFLKKEYKETERLKARLIDRQVTVHIVPHSHDDVGWTKTVDEYFTGSHQSVTKGNVNMTITSVVEELSRDPKKTFSFVEMKFFTMWWKYQSEQTKDLVRQLVKNGQVDFITGGWSMHDEACTHFEDMIDNMMYGHQFLLQEFGYIPTIGWQIDPFGHSSFNARLFAEMGFDAWFFARMDFEEDQQRSANKTREWVWRPFYKHLGNQTQIFTSYIYGFYYSPDGFDYDDRSYGGQPTVVDPTLETFNADAKVDQLSRLINAMLDQFHGDNIMIVYGGDFEFINSRMNFITMDRLITYFNSHVENAQLMYSTPVKYIKSLKQQNLTYTEKFADMFPYRSDNYETWSGYFTSRANSKKFVRDGQAQLHSSSKLYSQRMLDQTTTDDEIQEMLSSFHGLMDSQGILQHHDGVSGTSEQWTVDDYNYRIYNSSNFNNAAFSKAIQYQLEKVSNIKANEWLRCSRENGTYLDCPISINSNKDYILVVYNPTFAEQYVSKVKVQNGNYQVYVWNETTQVFDEVKEAAVICVERAIESGTMVNDCDLHIKTTLNASEITVFQLKYNASVDLTVQESTSGQHVIQGLNESLLYTGNDSYGVRFDLLKDITGKTYKVAFDLRTYLSYQLDGIVNSNSGAYVFRPKDNDSKSEQYATLQSIKSFDGGFVQEMGMNFTNANKTQNAYVRMRYYSHRAFTEWDVYLAGLPYTGQGYEVTVNWKSFDLDNKDVFYTDMNGLEMQERVKDKRPDWNLTSKDPQAANYYPVNSAISIVDTTKNLQMTVVNERAQGGSVLETGRIELMQQRRLYSNDGKGLEHPMNETDQYGNGMSVPAVYRFEFLERDQYVSWTSEIQLTVYEPLQYFFSFDYTLTDEVPKIYQPDKNFLRNVNLTVTDPPSLKYSLFPLEKNKIMVRLINIGDRFFTDYLITYSTLTVNLTQWCIDLFESANSANPNVKLQSVQIVETTMSTNQNYTTMQNSKFDWQVNNWVNFTVPDGRQFDFKQDFTAIDLVQQRIRQFNVTFVPSTTSDIQTSEEKEYFIQ